MIGSNDIRIILISLAIAWQGCGSIKNPFEGEDRDTAPEPAIFEVVNTRSNADFLLAAVSGSNDNQEAFGAYLSAGEGERTDLQIIDITRPESPLSIGQPFQGEIRKASLTRSYLFTLEGARKLSIFSLANRSEPKLLGILPLGEDLIHDFTFDEKNNFLFVSSERKGLLRYKVSAAEKSWTGSALTLPSSIKKPYTNIVTVDEDIFVTDAKLDQIYNLTTAKKNTLKLASAYKTNGKISKIKVQKNHLIICDFKTGLHILKKEDKNWELTFNLDTEGVLRDATIHEDKLILASDSIGRSLGLDVIDWSNLSSPFKIARYESEGLTLSVSSIMGLVYTIEELDGERSLNILKVNL